MDFRQGLLVLIAALSVNAAAGAVYKWKDDAGNVYFSDRKPEKPAERIEIPATNINESVGDPCKKVYVLAESVMRQRQMGKLPDHLLYRKKRIQEMTDLERLTVLAYEKSEYSTKSI